MTEEQKKKNEASKKKEEAEEEEDTNETPVDIPEDPDDDEATQTADEAEQRLPHVLLVPPLVRLEPVAVVVRLQVLQEGEEARTEVGLTHVRFSQRFGGRGSSAF